MLKIKKYKPQNNLLPKKDNSMPTKDSSYAVGWGRPPKHTQFKKGQSGNPKGRPKGRNNSFSNIFDKELKSMVPLSTGELISKQTAIVRQLVNKAATGDIRSQKIVLTQQQKAEKRQKGEILLEKLIKDRYLTH